MNIIIPLGGKGERFKKEELSVVVKRLDSI